MPYTIMVGVDGEQDHRAALDWASRRAARDQARLELVYVIQGAWSDGIDEADSLLMAAAESLLSAETQHARKIAARAAEHVTLQATVGAAASAAVPLLEVSTRYRYGHVGSELAAASQSADLLVVGTMSPKTAGARDHFTGSLAVRVAATAHCTVAVIPHDWQGSGAGIVAGVDGQRSAEVGLAFAADEADALDEPLTIVCAGYTANPLLAGLVPESALGDNRDRILKDAARKAQERHPGLLVRTSVAEAARSRGLAAAARGSRMLVVGTHNRHGVNRVMRGSVSHDLLLNVSVPTVVARINVGGTSPERTDETALEDDGS